MKSSNKETTTTTAPAPERGIHPEHREAAERLIARGRQQGTSRRRTSSGPYRMRSRARSVIHLYELGVEVKKRMALGRPKEFVDEATRFTMKALRFTLEDEEGGKELKR